METLSPALIGLSKIDLAKATATASDVLSTKTFYAGNNVLKQGVLVPQHFSSGSFKTSETLRTEKVITFSFVPAFCFVTFSNPYVNNVYLLSPDKYESTYFYTEKATITLSGQTLTFSIESTGAERTVKYYAAS